MTTLRRILLATAQSEEPEEGNKEISVLRRASSEGGTEKLKRRKSEAADKSAEKPSKVESRKKEAKRRKTEEDTDPPPPPKSKVKKKEDSTVGTTTKDTAEEDPPSVAFAPTVVKKKSGSPRPTPEAKEELQQLQRRKSREEASVLKALRPPPRNASKKYSSKDIEEEELEKNAKLAKVKSDEEDSEPLLWVQCEKCSKWRDIPAGAKLEDLPKVWYCELNTWDPEFASCTSPQKDVQDEGNAYPGQRKSGHGGSRKRKKSSVARDNPADDSGVASTPGTHGGYRRGTKKSSVKKSRSSGSSRDKDSSRSSGGGHRPKNLQPSISNMSAMMNQNNMIGKGKDGKNWNWVMCETCQQWRKLPPEVDVEALPEKWYCYMNKWDKQRNTCSAPQEADEGTSEQDPLGGGGDKNAVVRLPDGVNLYGGHFFPVKGRKHAPQNYRELIVNHYRHFNRYDQTTNSFLNARYYESSLFVPRGNVRGKKKKAYEKGLLPAPDNSIGASSRDHQGIASSAYDEHTTFRKIIGVDPFHTKQKKSQEESQNVSTSSGSKGLMGVPDAENQEPNPVAVTEFIQGNHQLPKGLLKLSKPWKLVGGWTNENNQNLYCV